MKNGIPLVGASFRDCPSGGVGSMGAGKNGRKRTGKKKKKRYADPKRKGKSKNWKGERLSHLGL